MSGFWHGDDPGFVFDRAPFFPARRGCSGLIMLALSYHHVFGDYTRPEGGGLHFSSAFVEAVLQGLRLGPVAVPILAAEVILVAIGIWSDVRQDRLFVALLLALVAHVPRSGLRAPLFHLRSTSRHHFTARGTRCVMEMLASRLQFWSYAAAFTCAL